MKRIRNGSKKHKEEKAMYRISNFTNNDDIKVLNSLGPFTVIEYQRDLSVMLHNAALAYFCNEMKVRKRQVICDVNQANITLQAGAMQWTVGNVNATTGVKGVGDLFGKAVRGKMTGESDQAGVYRKWDSRAGTDLQAYPSDGSQRLERIHRFR